MITARLLGGPAPVNRPRHWGVFGSKPAPYSYSGGKAEQNRLSEQGQIMHQQTMGLLKQAGLRPGMRVLDLGCGSGDVAFALANEVGHAGQVVAVDLNPEMVQLNQQKNKGDRFPRLTFETGNAESYQSSKPFDISFSRFTLAHLKQPDKAIQNMVVATKPGGKVVIEDVDIDTFKAVPHNAALEELKRLLIAQVKSNGGDATIGPKLAPLMSQQSSLKQIQSQSHQPVSNSGIIKQIPIRILDGIRVSLIQSGLATEPQLKRLDEQLRQLAADPNAKVYFPKIYQVSATKA